MVNNNAKFCQNYGYLEEVNNDRICNVFAAIYKLQHFKQLTIFIISFFVVEILPNNICISCRTKFNQMIIQIYYVNNGNGHFSKKQP